MKNYIGRGAIALLTVLTATAPMFGQNSPGGGGSSAGGGGGGGGGAGAGGSGSPTPEQRAARLAKMKERFDKNGDGVLDDSEKAEMQKFIQERRARRQAMQQGGGGAGAGNGAGAGQGSGIGSGFGGGRRSRGRTATQPIAESPERRWRWRRGSRWRRVWLSWWCAFYRSSVRATWIYPCSWKNLCSRTYRYWWAYPCS